MKNWIVGIVLCLGIAARADLVITEVMSSSSHTNTVANGDWWELYNSGASDVDLTGYSWDDNTATAGSADFNNVTIAAGATSATFNVVGVTPGDCTMIATAIGITTAIPAVLAYNYFLRQVKLTEADLENFATDFLHLALKTGFSLNKEH